MKVFLLLCIFFFCLGFFIKEPIVKHGDWWFNRKVDMAGVTLFPFIFIQEQSYLDSPYSTYSKYLDGNKRNLWHEKEHWKQQRFITLPIFLVLYALNYVLNLLYYLDHKKAYINIWFERVVIVAA